MHEPYLQWYGKGVDEHPKNWAQLIQLMHAGKPPCRVGGKDIRQVCMNSAVALYAAVALCTDNHPLRRSTLVQA